MRLDRGVAQEGRLMRMYRELFASTVDFCDRLPLPRGLEYTVSTVGLGTGLCLNALASVNVLWALGVLQDPYDIHGTLNPRRYIGVLICLSVTASTLLARIRLRHDGLYQRLMPAMSPTVEVAQKTQVGRHSGPAYILMSSAIFLITLGLGALLGV